ncbi:hypothetical protein IV203_024299 [Nitzschia inconspicua]|uniref:Uncharacterized protein n=1 Tax=Nitzschia inconspicua TaxID=303405 RepID=A0A9K3KCN4_9STRA|nr:hypothetical protein IV203_024299 [Nitzschia inconspicua]
MIDEIDLAVASGKGSTNPVGVAESLVNWDKDIIQWGFGYVDDAKLISRELVRQVLPKCAPLNIKLRKDGTAPWAKRGHAHGGLIRREILRSSPGGSIATFCSVYPVTAKHNLRRVVGDTGFFIPKEATILLSDNEIDIMWDELGWLPTEADCFDLREGKEAQPALSPYGFDVSVGNEIAYAENPACAAKASFQKVREDFKFEKGQKVGMAVFFTNQTKPTRATIAGAEDAEIPEDFGEAEIKKYYGEPGRVNIYTGEIKYVGPKHIEYSINSFTGCSGAVVFLLDKDQPASVDQSDWGRAVAIHSGAHPLMSDRNYGFLINEHSTFETL